jgi:hypothetical protein
MLMHRAVVPTLPFEQLLDDRFGFLLPEIAAKPEDLLSFVLGCVESGFQNLKVDLEERVDKPDRLLAEMSIDVCRLETWRGVPPGFSETPAADAENSVLSGDHLPGPEPERDVKPIPEVN